MAVPNEATQPWLRPEPMRSVATSEFSVAGNEGTSRGPPITILSAVGAKVDADGSFRSLDALPPGFVGRTTRAHKLLVLRGFEKCSAEQFLSFAKTFDPNGAKLLEWPSGPIMDVAIDDNAVNYLFSRECVPFHWDGFFATEPSYLVFQCVKAPEQGGATLFSDGMKIVDHADAGRRRFWSETRLTYTVEKKAHYGGVATLPVIKPHPLTGRDTLRYAEPVATTLNPLTVSCADLTTDALASLVSDLRRRLYDRDVCYAHAWCDGDIVIADNHALLHARTAITGPGHRHLRRIQIL